MGAACWTWPTLAVAFFTSSRAITFAPKPGKPLQDLRQGVDLIIMAPPGKAQQLGLEVVEPICCFGKQEVSHFDLYQLSFEARDFVAPRSAADGLVVTFAAKLL